MFGSDEAKSLVKAIRALFTKLHRVYCARHTYMYLTTSRVTSATAALMRGQDGAHERPLAANVRVLQTAPGAEATSQHEGARHFSSDIHGFGVAGTTTPRSRTTMC